MAKLVALMEEIQPDSVLSFGPDGMTGHTDHQATCAWATEAFRRAGPPGARLLYATKTPEFLELWLPYLPPEVMMDPNAQIPSTPPEELAVDVELPDDLLELKMHGAARPGEPDHAAGRGARPRRLPRLLPLRVLPRRLTGLRSRFHHHGHDHRPALGALAHELARGPAHVALEGVEVGARAVGDRLLHLLPAHGRGPLR